MNNMNKTNERLVSHLENIDNSLKTIIGCYVQYMDSAVIADHVLYWFDYEAGYTTVMTEFG